MAVIRTAGRRYPAAAISFGDMPNDLAMFRVTARSYSVGDSDPEVMRAATDVLPSVEDDGFARKIADLAASDWTIEDPDPAAVAAQLGT